VNVCCRKAGGAICCGHFITQVAQSLNLHEKYLALPIPTTEAKKLNKDTMYAMGILRKIENVPQLRWRGGTRTWTPPDTLAQPLPAELPEVHLDRVREPAPQEGEDDETDLSDPDPVYRPPRSYRAVRLPPQITTKVAELEAGLRDMRRVQDRLHQQLTWLCTAITPRAGVPPCPPSPTRAHVDPHASGPPPHASTATVSAPPQHGSTPADSLPAGSSQLGPTPDDG
jgi:hypothetical protein